MTWWRVLMARLRAIVHSDRVQDEIAEELQFHLDMKAQQLTRDGLSPGEARAAARRSFGSVADVRAHSYDVRGCGSLGVFWRNTHLALRGFRRTPVFAGATVLILGLGIGMGSAMATIYDAILLRKLPVVDQDRIVVPQLRDLGGAPVSFTPSDVAQLGRQSRTMNGIASVWNGDALLEPLDDAGRTVVLQRSYVSANFFSVLGAHPAVGRFFQAGDDAPGAPPKMVLSYHMWIGHFGADPAIVGRGLREPYTGHFVKIIGVAPPGLDYPVGSDAWGNFLEDATTGSTIVARLAASATPAAAGAEFLQLARDLLGPGHLAEAYRIATPTLPQVMFVNVRLALTVLTISVGLLLLTVCLNVGNLLLARANSRTREIAVRRALGANRWDIVRQFGVETLLLAIAAGGVGLALGEAFLRVMIVTAPPGLPRSDVVRLAGTPLLYTAVITLASGIVCGITPAFALAKRDAFSALRADTRSGREGFQSHRVRRALVVSQMALAVLLVSAAALLTRSLERLQAIDLGYEPEHLSILVLSISPDVADSPAKSNALYDDIARRLRAMPSVMGVTPIATRPFEAPDIYAVRIVADGGAIGRPDDAPRVSLAYGGSEYFRVLGIPIQRGRAFLPSEMQKPADVAVVSEQTARLLWANQDPIGKRVRFGGDTEGRRWWTVVGVAGDIRYRRLTEQTATLYLPWRVLGFTAGIAVRTAGPLSSSLHGIREAVREANPRLSIWYAEPATRDLDAVLAQPRVTAGLASVLGLSSLLIAVLGLYAIMTSAVGDRVHEIGIRMAMGATPWRVRRAVMTDALKLTTAGTAVGLAAALFTSRLIVKLLFQVNPADPAMLVEICAVLFGVGLIAAYLPAQRATRADPAASLRSE